MYLDISWLGREKPANLCKQSNSSLISDACLRAALASSVLTTLSSLQDSRLHTDQLLAFRETTGLKESGIKVRAFFYSHTRKKYFLFCIQQSAIFLCGHLSQCVGKVQHFFTQISITWINFILMKNASFSSEDIFRK